MKTFEVMDRVMFDSGRSMLVSEQTFEFGRIYNMEPIVDPYNEARAKYVLHICSEVDDAAYTRFDFDVILPLTDSDLDELVAI